MADEVAGELEELIRERGRITFAHFMELALYSPRGGYYVSGAGAVGRDYYTAPAAHPAFGALVAPQLEQLWEVMGSPSPFYVMEVGSGSGILARDILAYASRLASGFSQALEYVQVEYDPGPVIHSVGSAGLPLRDVVGCILSNELVDSFPVHRFAVQDGRVREVYVTMEQGRVVEVLGEPSTPRLEERLSSLSLDLAEGFRGEVNLALVEWTEKISQVLQRGFVLTFDYGHLAQELYVPQRSRGTLRCYYRHVLGSDPYRRIGQQDITAHVDFTALMRSGEEHGLATVGFTVQRDFLRNLGFSALLDSLGGMQLSQRERDANRMAMLDLVKPGEMGDFKVLAQARGLDHDVELLGFTPQSPLRRGTEAGRRLVQAPLLSGEHVDLLAARYPHLTWEWEDLWPFDKGS